MPRHPLVTGQGITHRKLGLAKQLRADMTGSELLLWERLRAGRAGYPFRKQSVVEGFIVDFLCASARVAVEVDGAVHDQQIEEDARRDEALGALGLVVLRFRNEEIDSDIEEVVERIVASCRQRTKKR